MSDFLMKERDRFISKWISLDDQIPIAEKDYGTGISDHVLVHVTTMPGVSFGEIRIACYDRNQRRWMDAWHSGEDIEWTDGYAEKQTKIVTHWMPIPNSPYISHPNPGPHTVNP